MDAYGARVRACYFLLNVAKAEELVGEVEGEETCYFLLNVANTNETGHGQNDSCVFVPRYACYFLLNVAWQGVRGVSA